MDSETGLGVEDVNVGDGRAWAGFTFGGSLGQSGSGLELGLGEGRG